jgi:type III secretory pathway component EscT
MEQEKMMFMSWINKNITLIVGIICVIALAIIIYVSVGGVTKVINVMAEALKVAPTCNVQQMQQIAKNVSIF